MKSLTKPFVAIATLFALTSLVSCRDAIIPVDQLPAEARSFLQEYFAEKAVSYVKKDRELAKTTYEVVFQDGTEIDLDGKGRWDKVDGKRAAVPAALIPETIADYVRQGFPGQEVVKIDLEPFGYEIELASGLELRFDKKGKLVNIDD